MAFIRWRLNSAGNRQAYLVHSYRDAEGKPRHKVLAYLGASAELTPDRIGELRQKYPELNIRWDKIKPSAKRLADVSGMSDADILRHIRKLRHERGWSQIELFWKLRNNQVPEFSGPAEGSLYDSMGDLEKALEKGEGYQFFLDPEAELAPILRRAFNP
jgi:hypothetical protein